MRHIAVFLTLITAASCGTEDDELTDTDTSISELYPSPCPNSYHPIGHSRVTPIDHVVHESHQSWLDPDEQVVSYRDVPYHAIGYGISRSCGPVTIVFTALPYAGAPFANILKSVRVKNGKTAWYQAADGEFINPGAIIATSCGAVVSHYRCND